MTDSCYILVNSYINNCIGLLLSVGDCMWDWCIENRIHISQQFTFLSPSAFLCAGCIVWFLGFHRDLIVGSTLCRPLVSCTTEKYHSFSSREQVVLCTLLHCFLYTAEICILVYLSVVRVIVRIKQNKALIIIVSPEDECWYQDFPCFLMKSFQCLSPVAAPLTQKSKTTA